MFFSTFQMYYIWKPMCNLPTWKNTTNRNHIVSLLFLALLWSFLMIMHSYVKALILIHSADFSQNIDKH